MVADVGLVKFFLSMLVTRGLLCESIGFGGSEAGLLGAWRSGAKLLDSAPLLRQAVDCSQRAAPGEVMVPWNEPKVKCVPSLSAANACMRSTGKLPWAPVNRPVPPVMV
jgi:hypothetical protein